MSTLATPPSAGNLPPENLPFVAPCRSLEWSAALRWLLQGWRDFRQALPISLTYGAVLTALSLLILLATWRFGLLALYLGLATGFVFVGPVLAVGLYSISRQLARGQQPVLGYCLREGREHIRELLVLGMVLLIILLLWARAAAMVHVFFPTEGEVRLAALATFLGVGSLVGAVFAAIVFAATAFSLPMLLDRRVDAITAVLTSVNAVLRNKGPLLLWGLIIVAAVILGFATATLGFVVLLPVIGHATWHAYRETIDASAWPENRPQEAT
ncbi:MAG: DUF2189 domain-containing protein [Burkholderiales bacterium]|jgi:uncharacterized membrane protein|nr:DUF2189 domain-containing protein [Burkholderiales bacterium]